MRISTCLLVVVLGWIQVGSLAAQRTVHVPGAGGVRISCTVYEPEGYDASRTYPIELRPGGAADSKEDGAARALAQGGWIVMRYKRSKEGKLADVLRYLRLSYRIETQRVFLFLPDAEASEADVAEANSWRSERPFDFNIVRSQRQRARIDLLVAARKQLLPADPAKAAVGSVLDDFHDCAAKADGPRYFDHFAPRGVFLGTDATERWPQAEFRKWGMKYFERDSAWIYVPQQRHIEVVGDFAWFDEILRNDSYGECRGSGALQRIRGAWKIAQYHLTVPVPNPLMKDVVARIRAAANGSAVPGTTTVFVVRHAEKLKGKDPGLDAKGTGRAQHLARILRSLDLAAVYATQFRRTRDTGAPTAAAHGIEVTALDARADVAKQVLKEHRGKVVLIVGHSNTVPRILRRLGVRPVARMSESDYGDLFCVSIGADGQASSLQLRF